MAPGAPSGIDPRFVQLLHAVMQHHANQLPGGPSQTPVASGTPATATAPVATGNATGSPGIFSGKNAMQILQALTAAGIIGPVSKTPSTVTATPAPNANPGSGIAGAVNAMMAGSNPTIATSPLAPASTGGMGAKA